jgi:hypothetical protein
MRTKKMIQAAIVILVLGTGIPLLWAQTGPEPTPAPTATMIPGDDVTPTPTPGDDRAIPAATPLGTPELTPSVSPTPSCAAPGASASSKASRNYAAWCSANLPGVLFEQDDANNGVSYLVFNSSDKTVDVRIGATNLVNMDADLDDGWIRVAPRKQQDLGRLNAYDPNQDWSGAVTASAELAK